jgi:hypothetical protein
MSEEILDEIRRLRKEIEVQTAINVIEGVAHDRDARGVGPLDEEAAAAYSPGS